MNKANDKKSKLDVKKPAKKTPVTLRAALVDYDNKNLEQKYNKSAALSTEPLKNMIKSGKVKVNMFDMSEQERENYIRKTIAGGVKNSKNSFIMPVVEIVLSQGILGKLDIPKATFIKMLKSNKPSTEVAYTSGLSQRTIQRLRKELRDNNLILNKAKTSSKNVSQNLNK